MDTVKIMSIEIGYVEREGKTQDMYLIKINNRDATSFVNGSETGHYRLSPGDIARLIEAESSDAAFAILEEKR